MSKQRKDQTATPDDLAAGEGVELTEEELKKASGGAGRRFETDFGDPIGNYNFKVEIEGVDSTDTSSKLKNP